MSIKPEQIVEAARGWLGTPFRHIGRTKGRGCDCVGLPLMVGEELGMHDRIGELFLGTMYNTYSAQPVGNLVLDCCSKHLVRKAHDEQQPGDIIVMKVETAPCHCGILSGDRDGVPHFIHAYLGCGKVVEQPLDYRWARRVTAVFRFPEVE